MANDGMGTKLLRVDGGMTANSWVCQHLSDVLRIPIDRPVITETTALGACYLAGLQVGIFDSLDELQNKWQLERQFVPALNADIVNERYKGWLEAVRRIRTT